MKGILRVGNVVFTNENIASDPWDLSKFWYTSLPLPNAKNDSDGGILVPDEMAGNLLRDYAAVKARRDNLLSLHATLQDALTWLDKAPEFDDYRRKVIACLRSTEKVLGLTQSRPERKR